MTDTKEQSTFTHFLNLSENERQDFFTQLSVPERNKWLLSALSADGSDYLTSYLRFLEKNEGWFVGCAHLQQALVLPNNLIVPVGEASMHNYGIKKYLLHQDIPVVAETSRQQFQELGGVTITDNHIIINSILKDDARAKIQFAIQYIIAVHERLHLPLAQIVVSLPKFTYFFDPKVLAQHSFSLFLTKKVERSS